MLEKCDVHRFSGGDFESYVSTIAAQFKMKKIVSSFVYDCKFAQ